MEEQNQNQDQQQSQEGFYDEGSLDEASGIDYSKPPEQVAPITPANKSTIETLKEALANPAILEALKKNPEIINDIIKDLPTAAQYMAKMYLSTSYPELYSIMEGKKPKPEGDEEDEEEPEEEEEEERDNDDIDDDEQDKIIQYAYNRKKKGWLPGKIAKGIWDNFRVDMHPPTVSKMIERYEETLELDELYTEKSKEKDKKQNKMMSQILEKVKALEEDNRLLKEREQAAKHSFKQAIVGVGAYIAGLITMFIVGKL